MSILTTTRKTSDNKTYIDSSIANVSKDLNYTSIREAKNHNLTYPIDIVGRPRIYEWESRQNAGIGSLVYADYIQNGVRVPKPITTSPLGVKYYGYAFSDRGNSVRLNSEGSAIVPGQLLQIYADSSTRSMLEYRLLVTDLVNLWPSLSQNINYTLGTHYITLQQIYIPHIIRYASDRPVGILIKQSN